MFPSFSKNHFLSYGKKIFFYVLGSFFLFVFTTEGFASTVRVGNGLVRGVSFSKKVRTAKELRDQGIVFQQLDYSCGSAALATILVNHLGLDVTEEEIIEYVLRTGNLRTIIERQGFSLLDLKRFVKSRGYRAEGYRLGLDSLEEIEGAWIAPILVYGYRHFVVVRAIEGDRVFLSDPARGRLSLPLNQFKRFWFAADDPKGKQGIGFVIKSVDLRRRGKHRSKIEKLDRQFLEDQQIRSFVKARIFFVPQVSGEF